jgi:hypothetical protein
MSTNPYAPPKAEVADVAPSAPTVEPIFFAVSRKKLIVLLMVTFTLYQLVWFYKNWALERRRGESVLPLARTIFAVLFCYSLFDRVRNRAARAGVPLPAGLLATGYIVFSIAGNVLDRVVPAARFPPVDIVTFLLIFGSVFFLLPVQSAINAVNKAEAPDHDANDRFTPVNWLWIVVGGLLLTLTALGLLVPEP